MAQRVANETLRVRPNAIVMWVVGSPAEAIGPVLSCQQRSHAVVLKRRPYLSLEQLTRSRPDQVLVSAFFILRIQPLQNVRYPANVTFRHDNLEIGMPLQRTAQKNRNQAFIGLHGDERLMSSRGNARNISFELL